MTAADDARRQTQRALIAVVVLAIPYLWLGLGHGSITNSDDGITASVIRGMARGEGLGAMTFQGTVTHQRPLLFYWLAGGVAWLFGTSEGVLRSVPAFGVLACALLVALGARRLGAGAVGAVLASCLFLGLFLPVWTSRRIGEDSLLAAELMGATLALMWSRDAGSERRAWITWGVCAGLAALTKGVVASVAVVIAVGDVLVWRRAVVKTRWPWIGAATAFAVAAPWHLIQLARFGGAFAGEYFGYNALQRATTSILGKSSPLFYAHDLLTKDPLLAALLAVGVIAIAVHRRAAVGAFAIAVLVPALLFSAAATRIEHYMLPAYPPLCALAGAGLAHLLRKPLFAGVGAAAVLAIGVAQHPAQLLHPDYDPVTRALALEARTRLEPGDTLYVLDHYFTAAAFYSDRRTLQLTTDPAFFAGVTSVDYLARSGLVHLVKAGDVAQLARAANAVAELHGETSRAMWKDVPEAAPILSVTNGVHAPTWQDPRIATAYREGTLVETHLTLKRELLAEIRARTGHALDEQKLLVGFARRAATYKRADLIFRDPDVIAPLLASHRVQLVFAGKAHPADAEGKSVIAKLVTMSRRFPQSVVFLENYEMALASKLVRGADVWLNNPRRPLEASGTSGMKAAMNGVMNVSILDGWWPEGCVHGVNGWQIGDESQDLPDQDERDRDALHHVLVREVLAAWEEPGRKKWGEMMAASIEMSRHKFSSDRMLEDYVRRLYVA